MAFGKCTSFADTKGGTYGPIVLRDDSDDVIAPAALLDTYDGVPEVDGVVDSTRASAAVNFPLQPKINALNKHSTAGNPWINRMLRFTVNAP